MSYKVNPLSFRLGISRVCITTNNVYVSNYSFLWSEYFKYEKFLFLFFYKYKFWVVSTKMLFQSSSCMSIFCNYYKLRPYFNAKPYRKKKRASYDPDGKPRNFHFTKYFDRIFFKKSVLKYCKTLDLRKKLTRNVLNYHFNQKHNAFNTRFVKYLRSWFKSLKVRNLGIVAAKSEKGVFYKAIKKKPELVSFFKSKRKYKKLKLLLTKIKINKFKFLRFIYYMRRKIIYALINLKKRKKYTEYLPKTSNMTVKVKTKLYLFKTNKQIFFRNIWNNKKIRKNLFAKNKFLNLYNDINGDGHKYGPIFNITLISDKVFFFHLKRILKCIFFKKKLYLKLRNIENLIPYKLLVWEDALRTSFLIQIRKKHFIRTIFKDFSYLNKIAYLEMDAQLFTKIIINMFEMTKFHRRLIYLLRSVFKTLSKFYTHIDCKVKIKGKMQYKRRTKTVYIFKQRVIPLNVLNISIEYGKGPANTPFGVIGIKSWIYYKYYTSNTSRNRINVKPIKGTYLNVKPNIKARPPKLLTTLKYAPKEVVYKIKDVSRLLKEKIRWERYCRNKPASRLIYYNRFFRIPKVKKNRIKKSIKFYIKHPQKIPFISSRTFKLRD